MIGHCRSSLIAFVALLVAGCAAGPPPPLYVSLQQGGDYGFSEEPLAEPGYRIRYAAPVEVSHYDSATARRRIGAQRIELAYNLAVWRACDLALAAGYAWVMISDRHDDLQTEVERDLYRGGFYHGWPGRHGGFYAYQPWPNDSARAWVDAAVSLTARFRRDPVAGAVDAVETRNRMRQLYGTAPATP